jgi:hypothetical protein
MHKPTGWTGGDRFTHSYSSQREPRRPVVAGFSCAVRNRSAALMNTPSGVSALWRAPGRARPQAAQARRYRESVAVSSGRQAPRTTRPTEPTQDCRRWRRRAHGIPRVDAPCCDGRPSLLPTSGVDPIALGRSVSAPRVDSGGATIEAQLAKPLCTDRHDWAPCGPGRPRGQMTGATQRTRSC